MTEASDYDEYLDTIQEIIDLQAAGQLNESLDVISANITKYGDRPEMLLLTAVCSYRQNAPGQAIELCERAHKIDPDNQEVVDSLAVLKTVTGNVNDGLYFAKLATALEPHPDIPDLLPPEFSNFFHALSIAAPSRHYLDGLYMFNGRRFQDAERMFEQELQLNPDNLAALKKLGHTQLFCGKPDNALVSLGRYVAAHPEEAEAWVLMAMGEVILANFAKAAEHCQTAVENAPDTMEILMQALEVARYFDGELAAEYSRYAERVKELALEAAADIEPEEQTFRRTAEGAISVALVSNDLRAGDQQAFVLPTLDKLDKSQIELTVYQQSPTGGPVFQEFKSKAPNWRRIVDIDDDVLSLILSRENTDVLLDLCGFSSNSRPVLAASRTAPVVTNLFCEPFGLGAPGTNIIISDDVTIAFDEAHLGEDQQIVRIEGGLFAVSPPALMGDVSALPAADKGHVTFGTQCKPAYFSPASIAFWCAALKAVDGSRLLLGNVLNIPSGTRDRIRELFAAEGMGDRIDFLEAMVADRPDKAFFNGIDVYLDSATVSGTAVLCHALWMGAPVVTAKGPKRSGLVGASILAAAGHPEWVGDTTDDAAAIAAALAGDTGALASTRAELREATRASALMDTAGYTKNLVKALKDAYDLVTAAG